MRSTRCSIAFLCTALSSATAFTLPHNNNAIKKSSSVVSTRTTSRLEESTKPTNNIETEDGADYEYNEADFADYTSDYSNDDDDDDDGNYVNEDDIIMDDLTTPDNDELDLYPDYNDIGGFDLSPFEKHAREVFLTYATQQTKEETDDVAVEEATIPLNALYDMLQALDIEATEDESKALFKYLDVDGDGSVTLDEVSLYDTIRRRVGRGVECKCCGWAVLV